ncbi:MAG: Type 1 glutamine amidotransferase-like domain-containing protein [Candidatus Nomurabacteria bacterium]|nr:Type 1 glutamine amidotransferase-like domain-containing protein [Candidatus Nomurabacteria bacterium]
MNKKTTVILHGGGNISSENQATKNILLEMRKYSQKTNPKILCVYYAKEDDGYQYRLFPHDQKLFESITKKENIFFVDRKSFAKRRGAAEDSRAFKRADIIYLRGGETPELALRLGMIYSCKDDIFTNKVVLGSSAGAYVLSWSYYCSRKKKVIKGLGIVPNNVICHFAEDRVWIQKVLDSMTSVETVSLTEEEYKIFHI